MQKYIWLSR